MFLSNELLQYISEFTDFTTSHKFIRLSKWCAKYIKIKYLWDNDNKLSYECQKRISLSELQSNNTSFLHRDQYSHLITLFLPGQNITQINHLVYLQELYINCNAIIND